jgi:hypothetical protein
MTQHNQHIAPTNSRCKTCAHIERPAAYCRKFVRTIQADPPAVLSCSGYLREADPATQPVGHSSSTRHVDALLGLVVLSLLSFAALVGAIPTAAGEGGGYPAPYLTATTEPTADYTPGAPTNTPVPPYGWWVRETAEAWQALPVRVWLVEVIR